MSLPKAVQQQIDTANKIVEQINAARKEEPKQEEPKQEEQAKAEEAPVVQLVKEQEQPAPVEQPAQEVQPKPAEDFEHKYRVLKGKYDAEVPRLSRQVAELNGQLEAMREMLANMQAPKAGTAAEAYDLSPVISEQEIDEYGEELIELIGKKAKQVAKQEIDSLNSQLTELKKQLGGVTQTVGQTARERLLSQLASEVQNWETLNTDPQFLDWLDQVDPYSGAQRGIMLRNAYTANDAQRVIAFFKGFLQEHAAVSSSAAADSPAVAERTPTVDLNEQVAPGRTKRSTGPVGAQKEKRIWTQAQIADFYRQVQAGKFRNKDTEKRQIEADIVSAVKEGRIR